MRVLDIGCGMGDVTMLVAQLVGPTGRVVSVDLDQASVETARKRAAAFGLDNTTFQRSDISTITAVAQFDTPPTRLGALAKFVFLCVRPSGTAGGNGPSACAASRAANTAREATVSGLTGRLAAALKVSTPPRAPAKAPWRTPSAPPGRVGQGRRVKCVPAHASARVDSFPYPRGSTTMTSATRRRQRPFAHARADPRSRRLRPPRPDTAARSSRR